MDRELWSRVEELFAELLDLGPIDRERVLSSCDDSAEVLDEVRSLLAFQARDGWLEGAVGDAAAEYQAIHVLHDNIDGYRLEGLLGSGGSSEVFRASRVDGSFEQEVAIKVLQAGRASSSFLGRFRTEREILARLRHPGIATILDGGTTRDDRPFLVMELIDGERIDQWCDAQGLDTRGRIGIFLRVCEAVQHAHQNLIVHRDLKPANILITREGHPKLLDFGIAKILADDSASQFNETEQEARVLTLAWASPEQIRGGVITTATDVYSLGMVLYQLLARKGPFDFGRDRFEAERFVCEETPPSLWSRSEAPDLKGDVNAIVQKALSKDAADRYGSVKEFAADLESFCHHRPVVACAPTRRYLVRKFVRRHASALIGTAVVATVLIGSLVFTSQQWIETDRARRAETSARRIAERRFGELRALVNALLFEIYDLIEHMPGATQARQLLASEALQYLDTLLAEAADDDRLRYELAVAYIKVGDVQGNPVQANLGDSQGALASYRKAEGILAGVSVRALAERGAFDLALLHDKFGEVLAHVGETQAALERHERALELREQEIAEQERSRMEPDKDFDRGRARSYQRLGHVTLLLGDAPGARAYFERGLALLVPLRKDNPGDPELERSYAVCQLSLGDSLVESGSADQGFDAYGEAIQALEALVRSEPLNMKWLRDLAVALNRQVRQLMNRGDHKAALMRGERAVEITRSIGVADPTDADARRELSLCLMNQGYSFSQLGRTGDALAAYREAEDLIEVRRVQDPGNQRIARDLWMVAFRRACLYESEGPPEAAEKSFARAIQLGDELRAADPENALYARFCALSHWYSGRFRFARGDSVEGHAGFAAADAVLGAIIEQGTLPRAAEDQARLRQEWKKFRKSGGS